MESLLRIKSTFAQEGVLLSVSETSTSGRAFGDNIKLNRIGDAQLNDRAQDLRREMKTNLSELDEAERVRIESEKLAHPGERFHEKSPAESDATTQLRWLKTRCEHFVMNSAHAPIKRRLSPPQLVEAS